MRFKDLISAIDPAAKVLDVGAGGLSGENTSYDLIERFPNYTGICLPHKESDAFKGNFPDKRIIQEDFYTHRFDGEKFDVIVLDLNIENNLKDWSDEGLAKMRELISERGFLISYVMTTDQYGNAETTELLKAHWRQFWESEAFATVAIGRKLNMISGFELFLSGHEDRRPYITWVILQKK